MLVNSISLERLFLDYWEYLFRKFITTYLKGGAFSTTYRLLMMLIIFSSCDKDPFFSFWKIFFCSSNWFWKTKSCSHKKLTMKGTTSHTLGVTNAFPWLLALMLDKSISSKSASKQSEVLINVWSKQDLRTFTKLTSLVDNCIIVDITSSRWIGSNKWWLFSTYAIKSSKLLSAFKDSSIFLFQNKLHNS